MADLPSVRNREDIETERTQGKKPQSGPEVGTRVGGTKIFVLLSCQKRRKVKKTRKRHENSSSERKWLT